MLKEARKFLSKDIRELSELSMMDISGFCNNTYIVEYKGDKIVVRFFENHTADYKAESATFRLMAGTGIGPMELNITSKYRVEEFIRGRPLSTMDLRNNFIKKSVIEALCDMNYDKNLTEASKQIKPPEHHFLTNFWKESGSFDTVRQIREVAKWQRFEAMPEVAQLQQVFDAVLQNGAEFKRQFQELLPMEDRAIDTVFSHNDFQENNMMLKDSDYSKIVLIDFEFSCLNNRGFDLATYYLESMITYKHMGQLPFKVYYDWCMDPNEVDAMLHDLPPQVLSQVLRRQAEVARVLRAGAPHSQGTVSALRPHQQRPLGLLLPPLQRGPRRRPRQSHALRRHVPLRLHPPRDPPVGQAEPVRPRLHAHPLSPTMTLIPTGFWGFGSNM